MVDSRIGKSSGSQSSKKKAKTTIKKTTAGRNERTPSQARRSRASDDRDGAQNRELTDAARLDEFRKTLFQSVLPDLPPIRGYHVCWLTTTNPRDSIAGRIRLGYEPVQQNDVPGWEHASLKTGEYQGCIGVNEMVAFKLPIHLYEMYMREAHHNQPLEEEGKLSSVIDVIREQAESAAKSGSRGIKFEVEEGTEELGQVRDPGSFAEQIGEY